MTDRDTLIQRLRRCSPYINGSAYCGMLRENDHGGYGPEFVSPGPYYVAEEVDAEIERLMREIEQREAASVSANNSQLRCIDERDRYRAALQRIANKPREDNEWDGVDKYLECQDIAREALGPAQEVKP